MIDKLREIDDPYPYFRGLICDLGYERIEIPYVQPAAQARHHQEQLLHALRHGHARASPTTPRCRCAWRRWPASCSSIFALLVALVYLVIKLMFWNTFSLGLAPLLIGIYFFGSVQLFFIGILGEYIGSIQTQVYHRPLVIEQERINFE